MRVLFTQVGARHTVRRKGVKRDISVRGLLKGIAPVIVSFGRVKLDGLNFGKI